MSPRPTGRITGNDLVLTRSFRASIEDVWTSGGVSKLEAYANLGVRQVWF